MIIHKNINELDECLTKFKLITNSPENFLKVAESVQLNHGKNIVKHLYDYAKTTEIQSLPGIPNFLHIVDMDEEQIWQQLELQNEDFIKKSLKNTSQLLASNIARYQLFGAEEDEEIRAENDDEDKEEENTEMSDSEEKEDTKNLNIDKDLHDISSKFDEKSIGKSKKTSVVDDRFFTLDEMRQFLDREDRKELLKTSNIFKDNDNEVFDYFNDDLSDDSSYDDMKNVKYNDFFGDRDKFKNQTKNSYLKNSDSDVSRNDDDNDDIDEEKQEFIDNNIQDTNQNKQSKIGVRFDLSKNETISNSKSESESESSLISNEYKTKNQSTHEQRQERLRQRINELEEYSLAEKSWQFKGEIDSNSRPQNSLLEEVLNFDATTRPPPIITEETTFQLEDIIKQRIKDKAWNDVERKYKPTQLPQEFHKKLVLDQEKSKESLAQIYEREYLQQVDKLKHQDNGKMENNEPEAHLEIRKIMKSLFDKLDALSNFFYTPRPAMPELRIITNTPAIEMEEVAPVAISDAQLLAPEDIKARPKGNILGESERSKTDKNRERRHKKLKQKHRKLAAEVKEKETKSSAGKETVKDTMKKVLKNRNVNKMQKTTQIKSIKSSKTFFTQLQDDVSSAAVLNKSSKKRPNSSEKIKIAKKFKL